MQLAIFGTVYCESDKAYMMIWEDIKPVTATWEICGEHSKDISFFIVDIQPEDAQRVLSISKEKQSQIFIYLLLVATLFLLYTDYPYVTCGLLE